VPTSRTIGRIVVGVDASSPSLRALELAGALASACDAALVVVHAVGLLEGVPGLGGCTIEVVESTPVLAVMDAVRRHGADLVVVGARGLGGFPGLQLGSTSQQLAACCPVPLTIVPSGRQAGGGP
jgi:nucleotide-binding universal stress UspA family protein